MSNWNASNYRQRKAERLLKVKPEWVINHETGEEFYLRPIGSAMSSVLAGNMPSGLTQEALQAWKEKGVAGMDNESIEAIAATLTPQQIEDGARDLARLSALIQSACVIPFLSNQSPSEIAFSDEWKADAMKGLKEKDPHFDPEKFDPKDYVLNPLELDGKDSSWLFRWAQGIVGLVGLKGGGAIQANDLIRFPKKLNRGSRAKPNGSKVRKSA